MVAQIHIPSHFVITPQTNTHTEMKTTLQCQIPMYKMKGFHRSIH